MALINQHVVDKLLVTHDKIMYVKMYVADEQLRNRYVNSVHKHNEQILLSKFPDAGFDIFTPIRYPCAKGVVTRINFQVKCMGHVIHKDRTTRSTGFYMYPRSSISKTPLMMANSLGIIDSGYRGDLIGAFRCLSSGDQYTVMEGDRLVQICGPELCPIVVELVSSFEELGEQTERGSGGFGSTGV